MGKSRSASGAACFLGQAAYSSHPQCSLPPLPASLEHVVDCLDKKHLNEIHRLRERLKAVCDKARELQPAEDSDHKDFQPHVQVILRGKRLKPCLVTCDKDELEEAPPRPKEEPLPAQVPEVPQGDVCTEPGAVAPSEVAALAVLVPASTGSDGRHVQGGRSPLPTAEDEG